MITDYASLQAAIADELNRSDLASAVPTFVQSAEDTLRLDRRVRKLTRASAFAVSTSPANLPADCDVIESIEHAGPAYFGPIEIVGSDAIGALQARYGQTGAPRYAARVGSQIVLAPAPDQSYTTPLVYWSKLPSLSSAQTLNWLLQEFPSIYLYAALVESAPYLKDDARVPVWKGILEDRLEKLHMLTEARQYGGTLSRRPARVIG